MKRYVVPEKLMIAVTRRLDERGESVSVYAVLGALAEVLADNPIVPTLEQVRKVFGDSNYRYGISENAAQWFATGWQEIMFLASESEVPEEIKALLWEAENIRNVPNSLENAAYNLVLEAYRRGKASKL